MELATTVGMTHSAAIARARRLALGMIGVVATTVGCTAEPDATFDGPSEEVTWHQDVAPIITRSCQGCHRPGAIAPLSFETYEDAAPYAELMAAAVERGDMPPWGAAETDDCAPRHGFKDDPRLSDDEVAMLRAWADGGAPIGDPDSAASLEDPMARTLSDPTHELQAASWHTEGFEDEFRCFVLDPELSEDQWLTGVEVVPGSTAVVHHAVVSLDAARETEALPGADGSYPCFGGAPGPFLGGYTPGAPPFEMPEGAAIRVPAGSLIVLNIHYHPTGFPGNTDATAVRLRMSTQTPAQKVQFEFRGNASAAPILQPGPNDAGGVEFRVPADVASHTETMRYVIPGEGTQGAQLWSVFPHMHYVGVDMEVRVKRANPSADQPAEECLLEASRYDFDWQRLYSYDAPSSALPTLAPGDELILTCTYDNTLSNPHVQRALDEQGRDAPVDVHLGEDTLDEMCVGLFGILLP